MSQLQIATMYTTWNSPIGTLTLISDGEFVTGIGIDSPPCVEHVLDAGMFKDALSQLKAYFYGELKEFDLPLRQQGTAFQQKVWKELCKIPFGETISYAELARRVGDAKACRAVGSANGKNLLAIVVPCHRVIAADGSLGGYAGGLWRKNWLLQHEKAKNPSLFF